MKLAFPSMIVRSFTQWLRLVPLATLLVATATATATAPAFARTARGAENRASTAHRMDPNLERAARQRPDRRVSVIVQFSPGITQARAAQVMRDRGGRRLSMLPMIHGISAQMPAASARQLATAPLVHAVSLNSRVVSQAETLNPGTLATWFNQDSGTPGLWKDQTGAGVGVAVIDTGVDGGLPDFATSRADPTSRVIVSAVVNPAASTASDTVGHGTMVASLIAGNGYARADSDPFYGKYVGSAPSANIIAIKASDDQGNATVLDVINAIQFAIDHQDEYNIRVINLSLTSDSAQSYESDPLDAAVEAAWFDGITVVVAAGNNGLSSDPADYAPANDPFVITVGAVGDTATMQHVAQSQQQANDAKEHALAEQNAGAEQAISDPAQRKAQQQTDQQNLAAVEQADHQQVQNLQESAGLPPPWSSAGTTQDGFTKPDVYGPGRFITADLAPDSTYATACATCAVDGQYITASGTSLSAPIVAGAAADLLGRHPHWTPDMVKGALMHTDHALPGYPADSAGVVNANAASGADAHKTSSDENLIPSSLVVSSADGSVDSDRSSWSRSSWSTASGALRAPWARSSWSCECSTTGGWAVGSTRSSWSSLTWTVDFGDVASPN